MQTFTTGQVANHFGVELWQVLAAIRRGLISEPKRVGHYRFFTEADLPAVEAGLRQGGYLRKETALA